MMIHCLELVDDRDQRWLSTELARDVRHRPVRAPAEFVVAAGEWDGPVIVDVGMLPYQEGLQLARALACRRATAVVLLASMRRTDCRAVVHLIRATDASVILDRTPETASYLRHLVRSATRDPSCGGSLLREIAVEVARMPLESFPPILRMFDAATSRFAVEACLEPGDPHRSTFHAHCVRAGLRGPKSLCDAAQVAKFRDALGEPRRVRGAVEKTSLELGWARRATLNERCGRMLALAPVGVGELPRAEVASRLAAWLRAAAGSFDIEGRGPTKADIARRSR
jgi:hypothetical protein